MNFNQDPAKVANDLIGKTLVVTLSGAELRSRIIEAEAYYAENDPPSRAYHGKKNYNAPMFDGAGKFFIYNVHKYWMLNFTTKPVSAVLIRALHPLNFSANLSGPGRLSMRLGINKELNAKSVGKNTGVWVEKGSPAKVIRSFRIGVRNDLSIPLRFFEKDNPLVSAHRREES